jgi:predicted TIM-barrel fold metal-dependent hydrolase
MTGEPAIGGSPSFIDVHAHFVTGDYVAAARAAGIDHPDGMPGWPSWSAEEHLRLMDTWGIGRSILSISSPGIHFGDDRAARTLSKHVNDFAAKVVRDHPDRFGHFAALPLPDVEGALQALAYALDELGSDGAAVETNAGGVYLGDARFAPLYEELDRRHAVIFVHPTSPPGAAQISLGRPRPMLEFLFDSTRTVSDLIFTGTLQRYPGIEWVFTHGGGTLPLTAARMEVFRAAMYSGGPDEPSVPEQVASLWFDIAGTPFPHQVPALSAAFGTERLLYGSDYCWTPPAAVGKQVASIDTADQPAGDSWRALTTRNAERLFQGRSPAC